MKVLHVIASLSSGGAEKLLVDLITGMKETKIDCEVLVFSEKNNFFGHVLENLGVKVHYSNASKIYSVKNIMYLAKIIKENKFDIVHTHLYSAQLFAVIAKVLSFSKVYLITTEHSTNNNRRNIKLFKMLDKIMYSKYDGIVAITNDVKNSLEKYLPNIQSKITLIQNGIDLNTYMKAIPIERNKLVLGELGEVEEEIWIVMVAGMRPAKDHETLIRASKRLPSKYRILFVGEGERMTEVKEYASSYGSKKITFLGARKDVPNILKASDIFVLSSHWEGFGLSLVEAAAAGKPVIASNVPGMNAVANAVGGHLFSVGDDLELSNLIQRGSLNIAQLKELEQFSINHTVKLYKELYIKLL